MKNKNIRNVKRIKIWILLIVCAVCIGNIIYDGWIVIRKMPFLAFYSNGTREDGVYFCSNGDMYQGFSEESFLMPPDEIAQRIQNNDYDGLLKYLGNCGAAKTRQMYVLFHKVYMNDNYRLKDSPYGEPQGGILGSGRDYDSKHQYWAGYFFDEEGKFNIGIFYISDDGKVCSDKRAYIIVKWMYQCLVKYAGY